MSKYRFKVFKKVKYFMKNNKTDDDDNDNN